MAGDIPKALALRLKIHGNIVVFVETGTYKGDTTAWAAEYFGEVLTMELEPDLYDAAVVKFGNSHNVECILGDSRDVLASIVSTLDHPALFWLDAHYGNTKAAGDRDECPLLGELEAIVASKYLHYILIDDARLFINTPPPQLDPACWPQYETIRTILGQRGYFVKQVGDRIVATPGSAASEVY